MRGGLAFKTMKKIIKDDTYFMHEALKEAKKAFLLDEVPIGAVIVYNDKIVERGHNLRESKQDVLAHAEINAIKKLNKKLRTWRLPGYKIYVTIEPCAMCAGAILWSRFDEIIYGAKDPKGGALGSSFNLFAVPHINHHPKIKGGVLEEECASLMKDFFKAKREKQN